MSHRDAHRNSPKLFPFKEMAEKQSYCLLRQLGPKYRAITVIVCLFDILIRSYR